MIIKYSEIKKINDKIFLFYGKNDGLKDEIIKSLVGKIKMSFIMKKKKFRS